MKTAKPGLCLYLVITQTPPCELVTGPCSGHWTLQWPLDPQAASGRKQHSGCYFPDLNVFWWTKDTSAHFTYDSLTLGIAAAPLSPFQCSVPPCSCCNVKFAPYSPTCCGKRSSGMPNSMSLPGIYIHLINYGRTCGIQGTTLPKCPVNVIPALKINGHNQPKESNVSQDSHKIS